MLKRALFAIIVALVIVSVGFGVCHSSQTRKIQERKVSRLDGPPCIPNQPCPWGR